MRATLLAQLIASYVPGVFLGNISSVFFMLHPSPLLDMFGSFFLSAPLFFLVSIVYIFFHKTVDRYYFLFAYFCTMSCGLFAFYIQKNRLDFETVTSLTVYGVLEGVVLSVVISTICVMVLYFFRFLLPNIKENR